MKYVHKYKIQEDLLDSTTACGLGIASAGQVRRSGFDPRVMATDWPVSSER